MSTILEPRPHVVEGFVEGSDVERVVGEGFVDPAAPLEHEELRGVVRAGWPEQSARDRKSVMRSPFARGSAVPVDEHGWQRTLRRCCQVEAGDSFTCARNQVVNSPLSVARSPNAFSTSPSNQTTMKLPIGVSCMAQVSRVMFDRAWSAANSVLRAPTVSATNRDRRPPCLRGSGTIR